MFERVLFRKPGYSAKTRIAGHRAALCARSLGAAGGREGPDRSVLDGDAGDVGALQGPANRFGLIAIEAGEAGPEQLLVAFSDHRFGKWIGFGEQAAGLTARRFDALPGF